MGYQALLFCPDEKTARTVTQVLSELEFTVESCTEPFAAVKKLMGAHFDAIVVDCDNEQNATLLFKSARNTTSNQASLAVAVVEGQAGVAKAFRIGANLVLTKPINIEQAKGTLRVARGLLRKGDPAKAAAPAATATTPAAAAIPPAAPVKPLTARPVPPLKPAAPATPKAVSTPRPVAAPVAKLAAIPAQAATTSSAAAPHDSEDVLPEILMEKPVAQPTQVAPPPVTPPAAKFAPAPQAARLPVPAATAGLKPAPKAASPASTAASFGSGAASAPAPAREPEKPRVAETSPAVPTEAETLFEKPALAAQTDSPTAVAESPAPSFTFGGANLPVESSGGTKKILLGVAAAILIVAGLYFGWTYFQGRASQPVSSQTPTTAAPISNPAKAAAPQPAPASKAPAASALSPTSQPATPTTAVAVPSTNPATDNEEAAPENDKVSSPSSTKSSSSTSSPASKSAPAAKAVKVPLVVKGGSVPAIHTKADVADAPAPSMIGIATPGSSAPPPNLVTSGSAPRLAVQTLNISQGVSQGLLIKKVQPTYPPAALNMHIEGVVQLNATISKAGDITKVQVLSGQPQLIKAASDAVKQWKYKPYLLNGEPVEIQTGVTINFKLPR